MHSVASSAIDDVGIRYVFAVVDEDGPDVYEDEEGDVGEFLKGEEEREEVVWDALGEAVEGMEGVRGVGRGHDPFVVGFVEGFVEAGVVETAVDPVDEEVGKADEEGELEVVVECEGGVGGCVVEFSVAANFKEEKGSGEDGHDGHGDHGLADFEGDLVLEVFGVGDGGVIEDEEVGKGGAYEVED